MPCDSSSLWSWSRKCSPSRPPSSGAPCPGSASWPWPRAATRTCRPWPRSSWTTSAPWSVTRRGARCVPSPPQAPTLCCKTITVRRVLQTAERERLERDVNVYVSPRLPPGSESTRGWLVDLAKGRPEEESIHPGRPMSCPRERAVLEPSRSPWLRTLPETRGSPAQRG